MGDYIRDLGPAKWGTGISLQGSKSGAPMSALGQKRTLRLGSPMSALPPKADIAGRQWDVRFVRKADSCTAAINAKLKRGSAYRQLARLIPVWTKSRFPPPWSIEQWAACFVCAIPRTAARLCLL
jgi:hypothetical protein